MKVVLVDDEKHALETFEWELKQCDMDIEILGMFDNPKEALVFLQKNEIDVLFLDVEMPFMNGFELLEALGDIDFDVVFTTAYDQFALHAFQVSAIGYLLKPIDRGELMSTLEKIDQSSMGKTTQEQLELLAKRLKGDNQKIALPSLEGLEFVNIEDIIRCQSDSNYTNIHLEGPRKILVSKTLKQISELLKEGPFYRVHNSHLINLKKIKNYVRGDGGYVILEDGSEIDVSRSKKKDFLSIFS